MSGRFDATIQLRDVNNTGSTLTVTADEMFAVCVIWAHAEPRGHLWLATLERRAIRCSDEDAVRPELMRWLETLPGWYAPRLHSALDERGLHLVWRRPGAS